MTLPTTTNHVNHSTTMNDITIGGIPLKDYLSAQKSLDITRNFYEESSKYFFYRKQATQYIATHARSNKPTIIQQHEVFDFYINELKPSLKERFHNLSSNQQQKIKSQFSQTSITSSEQAIQTITFLINKY